MNSNQSKQFNFSNKSVITSFVICKHSVLKTMKNQCEIDFKSKFHLLNSQESSEEIIWSCSDSSDYENTNTHQNLGKPNLTFNRKRKRMKTGKKALKNISNLDITCVEDPSGYQGVKYSAQSPVLQNVISSPILKKSRQYIAPTNINKVLSSPLLSRNNKNSSCIRNTTNKSPILILKHASPKVTHNVRKKLFENNNNTIENLAFCKENTRSRSPVLCNQIRKKFKLKNTITVSHFNLEPCDISNVLIKQEILEPDCIDQEVFIDNKEVKKIKNETSIDEDLHDLEKEKTVRTKITNVDLSKKVRAYFDSHLSLETPSQLSISECETTPKNSSKTSEEIEIITSQSEKVMPKIIKLENRSSSDSLRSCEFVETSKKVRHKKGGLAYRLGVLLRKQKATTSLWQHERFLAANSNFVLPTDDFLQFHIQNVTFQYGCYIMELKDVKELQYYAIINNLNMTSNNLEQWNVFKLYKPFKILDFNSDHKLIVNISIFECTVLNDR